MDHTVRGLAARRGMDRVSDWNDKMIAEFREGNGTAGRFGRALVIMHTTGAKSGHERLVPVAGFPTDDGWMVVARIGRIGALTNKQIPSLRYGMTTL